MPSKPEPSTRPGVARREDLAQLTELLGLLLAQETDFAPDPEKQRRALREILSDATVGRIYVVREGATVIAMASLLYTVSTAEGPVCKINPNCLRDVMFNTLK